MVVVIIALAWLLSLAFNRQDKSIDMIKLMTLKKLNKDYKIKERTLEEIARNNKSTSTSLVETWLRKTLRSSSINKLS